jgi:pimeloyl-ACP methyl ester carboxylesterase
VSRIRAVRPFEWAFPSRPAQREVLSALPEAETGKPPLLFVHGLAHGAWCFAEHWLGVAAERGFPAYAVSLRGHGGSGGGDRLRSSRIRDYVHDVVQTAVTLPRQPVLIGHSLGALVVGRALAKYPARAAVLLAPVPPGQGLGLATRLARTSPGALGQVLLGRTLPFRPEHLFRGPDGPTHLFKLGAESPLAQYQLALHRRPERPLGEPPVLVVGAGEDRLVPARLTARTARFYRTEPVTIPDIGHDLMLDTGWDRPINTILSWVDGLQEPA